MDNLIIPGYYMTISGILLLTGFVILAVLMITRILPTLLALPMMAVWIALISGIPFTDWLNEILLKGSMRLSSPITLVIFGSMFSNIIQKTGISDTIIKKAAEFSDDQPFSIAILMTAATAFIFLGMNGLGAIIMVGSIAIPIMTSAGIMAIDAVILILLGMVTGISLNFAGAATGIGIFGAENVLRYFTSSAVISLSITVIYIMVNIPRNKGIFRATAIILKHFFLGLLFVPVSFVQTLVKHFLHKPSPHNDRRKELPTAALITPIIPLVVIIVIGFTVGLGSEADGKIDPVAAALLGFLIASFYATIMISPAKTVNLFSGALIDGIKDIAGVIFLFMGIGMLVAATTHPASTEILDPFLKAVMPSSFYGMLIFFIILAPAALYRGPLNMYGMGSGIAAIMKNISSLPATSLYGMFRGVEFVQILADPTNSHNTWLAGYAGVDVNAVLKKILPYAWGACIMMMIVVFFMK